MTSKEDFLSLFENYQRLVRYHLYRLGVRAELEDLVQEVFIKVWRFKDQLKKQASVKSWILRIATTTAYDFGRKRKLEYLSEIPDQTASDFEPLQGIENQQLAEKALQVLSWDHRTAIVLHYFEDLSIEEIAQQLNVPAGTVKSRISAAKDKMQAYLEKKGVKL